ncbi:MFSD6 [Branchiostoma lanceolatum]|uniref:MFSD6 protein n=1 Tax=Branchiostoma lanceolatum TaxID=7740 RepID=A0A8J9ZFJ4_BRALA|nr:MFSD6 [Branchiostoma lanceolatum]
MYSASVTYASVIAPAGMETTMQGIVGAVYSGVGFASGALIGGAIFHAFGGIVLFRVYAVVCLVSCILYRLMPRFIPHLKADVASQGSEQGESKETYPEVRDQKETRTEISSKSYETMWENANVPCYTETSV